MTRPLVSVIMGVRDGKATLEAAVSSIVAQTLSDWELIACDDGSSDGSAELLSRLASQDERIVVLRNERNRGLAYSLNRCAAAARGRYLARMDADDLSAPERLATQIAFLEARPDIAFCGCRLRLFDENGVWGHNNYPEYPEPKHFLWYSPFAHPSVVFRAEVLKTERYDESSKVGRSEDYELFMRLYSSGYRGANLPERLFDYRESRGAYGKRKFRYALREASVRLLGYYKLGLLPIGFLYAGKPILIACLPKQLYAWLRRRRFS